MYEYDTDDIIVVTNRDGGQGIMDECKQKLKENEKRLVIKAWRQYYSVFALTCKKGKEPQLEPLFEIEWEPSAIGDVIKHITVDNYTYACRVKGIDLLNDVLVAHDKQISKEAKKLKQQVAQTQQQVINKNVQKVY